MSSTPDRIKLKHALSFETWTTREQLCLASSVLKSGDQNWMSVSRSLKPFVEKETLKSADWYSQKSCAIQYAQLLENTDMPRRKKRESGETTSESIVRKLTQERMSEIGQTLSYQREEYKRLKTEINFLKSNIISDEKLEKMWLDIQQEEREIEQKTRAHMAWLAKRQQQQKQEMNSPPTPVAITNQIRKLAESTVEIVQESIAESSTTENDEEKKNRGGRSPLLTSLLKSPSPTMQTAQTFPSTPVQVNSPTITSLLGSSPKVMNAQLAQNVSPQLQQLVSTAIASANATQERPSVGAPTLSMLLEMPASAQRGPLPNLQSTTSVTVMTHVQRQAVTVPAATTSEIHNYQQTKQSQSVHQMTTSNETVTAATLTTVATMPTMTMPVATTVTPALTTIPTATNIPVSENMVQIIDNIDDVIRKDIMADVIDKDEINDIIGDIEELIKEEITGSPQNLDTSGSTAATSIATAAAAVIGNLASVPQQTEIPVAPERPKPRDVDEVVSLSDSPQSEMAMDDIDSSTSNIAEIIGTVAIEPQEPKIIVTEITETISRSTPEDIKSNTSTNDEKMIPLTKELVSEAENNDTEDNNNTATEKKQLDAEVKSINVMPNVETEESNFKLLNEAKETIEETVEEETEKVDKKEEEETEMAISDDKESSENIKEQKELLEDIEGKSNAGLDQLEMHIAKITGDQQDIPSAEVSISSEVTNDVPSTEDTEKSQDISLILEDDESNQSSANKKKTIAEEQIIENTIESAESLESFKEESVLIKEKIIVKVKEEEPSIKSQEEEAVEETLKMYAEEFKKEEIKDSSEDTTSSILQDVVIKEEEISNEIVQKVEDTVQVMIEGAKIKSKSVEATIDAEVNIKKTENVEIKIEEPSTEIEPESTESFQEKNLLDVPLKEETKENIEIKEEKEEKKDTKRNLENEQNIKKEIDSTVGEEPGELDEEETSLSKLSGGRAMKTYSKKQNVAMDSEPENEGTGEGADYRAWKKAVMLVYNRLATHKYASVFLRPITEDQAPGYHSVIFRPMDLSTIKKNIDNGTIRSTMHFQRDVMLMFQNAIMYNKHDTFIYKMAISMQEECLQHMQILVQVTGEGSFRRETRTAASSSSEIIESSHKRKRSHITPSPHDTDSIRSKKRRKSEND